MAQEDHDSKSLYLLKQLAIEGIGIFREDDQAREPVVPVGFHILWSLVKDDASTSKDIKQSALNMLATTLSLATHNDQWLNECQRINNEKLAKLYHLEALGDLRDLHNPKNKVIMWMTSVANDAISHSDSVVQSLNVLHKFMVVNLPSPHWQFGGGQDKISAMLPIVNQSIDLISRCDIFDRVVKEVLNYLSKDEIPQDSPFCDARRCIDDPLIFVATVAVHLLTHYVENERDGNLESMFRPQVRAVKLVWSFEFGVLSNGANWEFPFSFEASQFLTSKCTRRPLSGARKRFQDKKSPQQGGC